MTSQVEQLIERLQLSPHPEGGWFRRTWTAPVEPDDTGSGAAEVDGPGRRAMGSSILYLLPVDGASQWHRIDAHELWTHAAGAAVRLETWLDGGSRRGRHTLGHDVLAGDEPQVVVPPGAWQRARSRGEWSLVVCAVVPEFRDAGFELADPDWHPPA